MTLNDILIELKDIFHSIDIRVFAHKSDGVWKNIFTIIRFRHETVEELKIIHQELIEKCGSLIETDKFRVGLFNYPVDRWSKIADDLSKKFLCLNDSFGINFDNAITYNHNYSDPHFKPENYVYKDWKCFSFNNESNTQKPNYSDELRSNMLENHFRYSDNYLSAIFEYGKYDFQSNPWIKTFVPIFFKIEKIEFDHDKVDIEYSAHEQKNIQVGLNFYKSREYRSDDEFIQQKIEKIPLTGGSEVIQDTITMKLDTKNVGEFFELLVIKNKKTLIESKEGCLDEYWKTRTEYTNPTYYAFEQFVEFEELERMLLQFKSKKINRDSEVFERGVSWLLSLLGIPNLILGEYERLGKGHDQTSTDILASFDTDKIFLINVTIGLPKQSDFDREREYRENIEGKITNKKIEIHSIYFTGKDATESLASATANNVILVGKNNIQNILEYLKKGNLEKARQIILQEDSF
ncbi:hypothetical protein [Nitrosopumilus sp.]|uniref:hypothetical protein n=1 Tax=Nitrosopumilus sp. TaxID=2024843 RepID=UPI00247E55D9|nr:hypothetical protein [Nitrosopumilus sp.]MCV0430471.1 hypothetical protein [Nitrosopumilus sp.]